MAFIFAVHVPIAGLALMPLLLGQPMLFGPIHIALLEMVIDPVCALVFEAEDAEADVMSRKPRDPGAAMFSLPMVMWSLFQGGLALFLLAGCYLGAMWLDLPEAELRGLMFFALIAAILALIFVNRSFSPSLAQALGKRNGALAWVLTAIAAVAALILLFRPVRDFLKFGPLHLADCAIAVATGLGLLLALEGLKPIATRGRHANHRHAHA